MSALKGFTFYSSDLGLHFIPNNNNEKRILCHKEINEDGRTALCRPYGACLVVLRPGFGSQLVPREGDQTSGRSLPQRGEQGQVLTQLLSGGHTRKTCSRNLPGIYLQYRVKLNMWTFCF